MPSEPEDVTTSNEEAAAFAETSVGRDVTLAAVRRLEAAAGRAGTGRETDWLGQVAADLSVLERAVADERHEASRPDSLLSMIARDYSRRFSSRIRQLREQHEDIAQTIASLRTQLQSMRDEPMIDVADLRARLSWLADAIRHRWGRETDLVYEAIRLDLGRADHPTQEGEI
jgi:hypothetical protein